MATPTSKQPHKQPAIHLTGPFLRDLQVLYYRLGRGQWGSPPLGPPHLKQPGPTPPFLSREARCPLSVQGLEAHQLGAGLGSTRPVCAVTSESRAGWPLQFPRWWGCRDGKVTALPLSPGGFPWVLASKRLFTGQVATSPRGWLSTSQLFSDPRWLRSLVLDPLKPAAGRFWGRVSAGHFLLFFFLWLLQQLFGFCPLLVMGRRVWPNALHPP